MMQIINIHRRDENVGDIMSAPTEYFNFPGFEIIQADVADAAKLDLNNRHVILGGGGLFDEFFLQSIDQVKSRLNGGSLIAWGIGQQLDTGPWWQQFKSFPYEKFLRGFDLVGLRDFGFEFPWVPCVSCMHTTFDKHRDPCHEFVVYSHRSRPVPIEGWPTLRNDQASFDETIEFLASGKTIITSSYHGMYWGMLLNRQVLAFPFNSKFLTLKYPITLYPSVWERTGSFIKVSRRIRGKESFSYSCKSVLGWRLLAAVARVFPNALEECREQNRIYYRQVYDLLSS